MVRHLVRNKDNVLCKHSHTVLFLVCNRVQIALLIGAHELLVKEIQAVDKAPGNFGTGYFGFKLDDQSAVQLRGLNVEVQNGRLAMLGILGMWASECIHGTTFWEFSAFK